MSTRPPSNSPQHSPSRTMPTIDESMNNDEQISQLRDETSSMSVFQYLQDIKEQQEQLLLQQNHQTQLILTMRSMINDLTATQTNLKLEMDALKKTLKKHQKRTEKQKYTETPTVALTQVQQLPSVHDQLTDMEVDAVIEMRKQEGKWPVRYHTLEKFSSEEELIKVRFHTSDKHKHVPINIPKTSTNKAGRLLCRLCSAGGEVKRGTSKMCSTCEVPLCVAKVGDNPDSHFDSWHSVSDLMVESKKCIEELLQTRKNMKRKRTGEIKVEGEEAEEEAEDEAEGEAEEEVREEAEEEVENPELVSAI